MTYFDTPVYGLKNKPAQQSGAKVKRRYEKVIRRACFERVKAGLRQQYRPSSAIVRAITERL